MKILGMMILVMAVSAPAFAKSRKPSSAKSCKANALDAAEEEYGNDPDRTEVTTRPNNYFVVTVGIGNPEDGAHNYLVHCPSPAPLCNCEAKEIQPKK
jgi:hypothetical protein